MSDTWSRRAFLRASTAAGAGALAARPAGLDAFARAAVRPEPHAATGSDDAFWREIRRGFALDPELVNFNNGNSSPSPIAVHDAFKRHLDTSNRLPVYYRGLIEQTFDAVRARLAAAVGCDSAELAFTRNATEALHIAQNGIDLKAGDEVLTTDQDYPRMLWAWHQRARREGIVVKRVPFSVPARESDLIERIERAMTPRTRVLQFCHMTNTTGQIFPVRELCRLARARGILTIVDGAQAAAHVPFALRDLECDAYGTSLHKWLMAPQGTGFLYVRRDAIPGLWPLQAAVPGMDRDIHKFEEIGTQGAAARAAISDALSFHQALGAERKAARLRALTLRWANALKDRPRVRLLSSLDEGQTFGLATVGVEGIGAPALAKFLFDRHRLVVSAVVSQTLPGPVFDFQGVRVTPNVYTTMEEVDRFVAAMEDVLKDGLPATSSRVP